jgi:hypothetical protein
MISLKALNLRSAHLLMIIVVCLAFTGCGPADSVHPTTDLSEEQKAAVRAEDQKVADEESQGSNKKKVTAPAKR